MFKDSGLKKDQPRMVKGERKYFPGVELSDQGLRTLFGYGGEAGQSKAGIVASINSTHRSSEELIYVRLAVLRGTEDAVDFNAFNSYLEVKSFNLSCIEPDDLVP